MDDNKLRVALLEDDPDQAQLVQIWLEDDGHSCRHFTEGTEFVKHLRRESYDVLILDWMVPELSGIQALTAIRSDQNCSTPVVFVTQRDSEQDIVEALQAGADDYMTKPIRRLELLARVSAAVRRGVGGELRDQALLEFAPYRIDRTTREITIDGEPVALTQKEYELAVFLFQHVGEIVSRSHLLESVWGTNADINTRTVDTHASRIRSKLGLVPDNGWKLTSIYQHGYRLEPLSES
ncbi:MAG: response regulator transcription factor [Gammaproteobacteria bacterium]|nr:response regulator transcription factor [Gammaproteobacteria bacterium]MDH3466667.1 response regulator transcription factor [Gammaproteobacteria bacterium]